MIECRKGTILALIEVFDLMRFESPTLLRSSKA